MSKELTAEQKAFLKKHFHVDAAHIAALKQKSAAEHKEAEKLFKSDRIGDKAIGALEEIQSKNDKSAAQKEQATLDKLSAEIKAGGVTIEKAGFKFKVKSTSKFDPQGAVQGGTAEITFTSHDGTPEWKKTVGVDHAGNCKVEGLIIGRTGELSIQLNPAAGAVTQKDCPVGDYHWSLKGTEKWFFMDWTVNVMTEEKLVEINYKQTTSTEDNSRTENKGELKGGGKANYNLEGSFGGKGEATLPFKIPVGVSLEAAAKQVVGIEAYLDAFRNFFTAVEKKKIIATEITAKYTDKIRTTRVGGRMEVGKVDIK